jgi:hypothetical protein
MSGNDDSVGDESLLDRCIVAHRASQKSAKSTGYGMADTSLNSGKGISPARRLTRRLTRMAADPSAESVSIYDIADVVSEAFCLAERREVNEYIVIYAELDNALHRGLFIAKLANIESTPAAPFFTSGQGNADADADDDEILAQTLMLRGRWFIWLLSATRRDYGGERAHPALGDGKGDTAKLLSIAWMLARKTSHGVIPIFIINACIRKHGALLKPYYGDEMYEFVTGNMNGYAVEGLDSNIGEHCGLLLFMLVDAALDTLAKVRPRADDPRMRAAIREFTLRRTILMMTYAMQCRPIVRNCAQIPTDRPSVASATPAEPTAPKSPKSPQGRRRARAPVESGSFMCRVT